jgi:hypothetical protein
MLWEEIEIQSPVLTLILDERAHNGLPPQTQLDDVDTYPLKEIRMIINSDSPSQIDETARRECCHGLVTIQQLAKEIVAPILDEIEVPTTVYVFHNFPNGPEDMKRLQHHLEKDLDERHERRGSGKARQYPIYTMKTLRDYISEGVEDEFLPEDLEYWRKEDQKRVGLAEKLKS